VSQIVIIHQDDPFLLPILHPCNSGLLISNKALDKPSSGAKNLGLGTLKESL
jgi:hypothetical protein